MVFKSDSQIHSSNMDYNPVRSWRQMRMNLHKVFKFDREQYYDQMLREFLFLKLECDTDDDNGILSMQECFKFDKQDIMEYALKIFKIYLTHRYIYNSAYQFYVACGFTPDEVYGIFLDFCHESHVHTFTTKLKSVIPLQRTIGIDKHLIMDKLLGTLDALANGVYGVGRNGKGELSYTDGYWKYVDKVIDVFGLSIEEVQQWCIALMEGGYVFKTGDFIDKYHQFVKYGITLEQVSKLAFKFAKMSNKNQLIVLHQLFKFNDDQLTQILPRFAHQYGGVVFSELSKHIKLSDQQIAIVNSKLAGGYHNISTRTTEQTYLCKPQDATTDQFVDWLVKYGIEY